MSPSSAGRSLRLRSQILLILLGVAILPLAIVGLWLARSAIGSGEALLRGQLEESANRFAAMVTTRWEWRRGELELLSENEATLHVVTTDALEPADQAYLAELTQSMTRTVPSVQILDLRHATRWASTPTSRAAEARARGDTPVPAAVPAPMLSITTRVLDSARHEVGTVVAGVAITALIPPDSSRPLVPGAHVGVKEAGQPNVGVPLLPGTQFPMGDRATIDGKPWLVAHRHVETPGIDIAIAAPLEPYIAPFQRAAGAGIIALLVVALLAALVTVLFARRATRALEELARASSAVTSGTLGQQVTVAGPREVRHVGTAFNVMTDNLRKTLDELSRRSALAAVGEFATSLSHDVRNALTSIKVDLDRLSTREVADPVAAGLIARTRSSAARLEAAVAGALRIARRGQAPQGDLDLRVPIRAAVETVRGTFEGIAAVLDTDLPAEPVIIRGDAAALQQLFANLLFNAAQALHAGGWARVTLTQGPSGAIVTTTDGGIGIGAEDMLKLDTPFFSSKPSGTGLGLPIARQIVAAHGGEMAIDSEDGAGTTVRVRLPLGTDHSTSLHEASSALASVE